MHSGQGSENTEGHKLVSQVQKIPLKLGFLVKIKLPQIGKKYHIFLHWARTMSVPNEKASYQLTVSVDKKLINKMRKGY